RLPAAEHGAPTQGLEQAVYVQRVLPAQAAAQALDQVIGAGGGVHPFPAPPDVLVGMDLYEKAAAAADEAAAHVGNLQVRRAGVQVGAFYGALQPLAVAGGRRRRQLVDAERIQSERARRGGAAREK